MLASCRLSLSLSGADVRLARRPQVGDCLAWFSGHYPRLSKHMDVNLVCYLENKYHIVQRRQASHSIQHRLSGPPEWRRVGAGEAGAFHIAASIGACQPLGRLNGVSRRPNASSQSV